MSEPGRSENYRFDIQVIRGVAVLAVVLFHAFPTYLPKGFLGVDVFFVISGFLITGHIMQKLDRGDFTFGGFYRRRAVRLIPASLTTFLVTTLVATVFLTRQEMADYAKQLIGSVTFTANFAIAQQINYFEARAETKPLLHIWSLSLEEQFYFVAPLILWLTPKRFRLPLLIGGAIASFALCWLLVSHPEWISLSPKTGSKAAFFMLPPRAWELLAGAIAAWTMLKRPALPVPRLLKISALVGILAIIAFGLDDLHPRFDALLVTVLTALLLVGQDGWLPSRQPVRAVSFVGDWSYSVYLVHWPMFAFAYVGYGHTPPMLVLVSLVGAALVLGWAQYTFIEQPFLKARHSRYIPFALGGAGLFLGAATSPALAATYSADMRPNVGLAAVCDTRGSQWADNASCRTTDSPTIAVWGDSYAMHLIPGLRQLPIVQMTKSACAPADGVSQISGNVSEGEARQCLAFNHSVIAALAANPRIDTVIVASAYTQIIEDKGQKLLIDGKVSPYNGQAGGHGILSSVIQLRKAGKRVIIVGPTPFASFDAGQCNVRKAEHRPIFGRTDCNIQRAETDPENTEIRGLLLQIASKTGSSLVMPSDVLCDKTICRTHIGQDILYRDIGHLTRAGSRLVMRGLSLKLRQQKSFAPQL